MSHINRIAASNNNFEQPSVTELRAQQAPTNADHPDGNNTVPLQRSNTAPADPTRLALLQFGTQARARANQLRGQMIGWHSLAHDVYVESIESAVTAALNAQTPIDEEAETPNICIAKLNEIYRFSTQENGQRFDELLSLPEIPPDTNMTTVKQADHKSAAILRSDLQFLQENMNSWINAPEIDEQVRNQCMLLLFLQTEHLQRST